MARLIQKSGYIQGGRAARYMEYIAKRDGVEVIHIFPPIEYATLAGNTAERCAIPMDRQLRLVQRLGFKPSTVQGNADFLEVAELLLLVVVIHSKNSFP